MAQRVRGFNAAAALVLLALLTCARGQVVVDTGVGYRLINKSSGLALDIAGGALASGAAAVQTEDRGAASQRWHLMPAPNNQYKIANLNSGELLGIANASRSAGAAALQSADNGTSDHLWQIADAGGGYLKLTNVNSSLLLGIAGKATAPGSAAVQSADSGDASQIWKLVPAGAAYPDPLALAGDTGVHDPSMVKTASGTYYLFGTHGSIRMSSSPDRVQFTSAGQALVGAPAWTSVYTSGDLWAPDVSYHAGKYWLYYAASKFGTNVSGIGVATSPDASPGSWSDLGMVVSSDSQSAYNTIDPGMTVDASGNWWLSFGSFWNGINLIQIDPATGKQGATNQQVHLLAQRPASPAIEGAYIYPHDGYYYLFASFDSCCQGVNSTYHIVVGRAANITGPYSDRSGIDMTQGGGTILLSTHGRYIGPGGQSVMHDSDGDLLVYHYYDSYSNGSPALGLNRLGWDSEGWPYLCGSDPPRTDLGGRAPRAGSCAANPGMRVSPVRR